LAIAVLIAAGNLLYGRNSHYAAAQARMRPRAEPPADAGGPDAAA
jgi:hypothetical protein